MTPLYAIFFILYGVYTYIHEKNVQCLTTKPASCFNFLPCVCHVRKILSVFSNYVMKRV